MQMPASQCTIVSMRISGDAPSDFTGAGRVVRTVAGTLMTVAGASVTIAAAGIIGVSAMTAGAVPDKAAKGKANVSVKPLMLAATFRHVRCSICICVHLQLAWVGIAAAAKRR